MRAFIVLGLAALASCRTASITSDRCHNCWSDGTKYTTQCNSQFSKFFTKADEFDDLQFNEMPYKFYDKQNNWPHLDNKNKEIGYMTLEGKSGHPHAQALYKGSEYWDGCDSGSITQTAGPFDYGGMTWSFELVMPRMLTADEWTIGRWGAANDAGKRKSAGAERYAVGQGAGISFETIVAFGQTHGTYKGVIKNFMQCAQDSMYAQAAGRHFKEMARPGDDATATAWSDGGSRQQEKSIYISVGFSDAPVGDDSNAWANHWLRKFEPSRECAKMYKSVYSTENMCKEIRWHHPCVGQRLAFSERSDFSVQSLQPVPLDFNEAEAVSVASMKNPLWLSEDEMTEVNGWTQYDAGLSAQLAGNPFAQSFAAHEWLVTEGTLGWNNLGGSFDLAYAGGFPVGMHLTYLVREMGFERGEKSAYASFDNDSTDGCKAKCAWMPSTDADYWVMMGYNCCELSGSFQEWMSDAAFGPRAEATSGPWKISRNPWAPDKKSVSEAFESMDCEGNRIVPGNVAFDQRMFGSFEGCASCKLNLAQGVAQAYGSNMGWANQFLSQLASYNSAFARAREDRSKPAKAGAKFVSGGWWEDAGAAKDNGGEWWWGAWGNVALKGEQWQNVAASEQGMSISWGFWDFSSLRTTSSNDQFRLASSLYTPKSRLPAAAMCPYITTTGGNFNPPPSPSPPPPSPSPPPPEPGVFWKKDEVKLGYFAKVDAPKDLHKYSSYMKSSGYPYFSNAFYDNNARHAVTTDKETEDMYSCDTSTFSCMIQVVGGIARAFLSAIITVVDEFFDREIDGFLRDQESHTSGTEDEAAFFDYTPGNYQTAVPDDQFTDSSSKGLPYRPLNQVPVIKTANVYDAQSMDVPTTDLFIGNLVITGQDATRYSNTARLSKFSGMMSMKDAQARAQAETQTVMDALSSVDPNRKTAAPATFAPRTERPEMEEDIEWVEKPVKPERYEKPEPEK